MTEWVSMGSFEEVAPPRADLTFSSDAQQTLPDRRSQPKPERYMLPERTDIPPELWDKLRGTPFQPKPSLPSPYLRDLDPNIPLPPVRYLQRLHPHPMDQRIQFVDGPHGDLHQYFIDGSAEGIMSATTFIHHFFSEFDSLACAQNTVKSKSFQSSQYREGYKYFACETPEDIVARWNWWRDLGTMLHANIECFLNGEFTEEQIQDHVHEENRGCFQQFLRFFHDPAIWQWESWRTEWSIFDPETRICGQIDFVGYDPRTHTFFILDWKRNESIPSCSFERLRNLPPKLGLGPCGNLDDCKKIIHDLQQNLYVWILAKNYGININLCNVFLIQMHPSHDRRRDPTRRGLPVVHQVHNYQDVITEMMAWRKAAISNQQPTMAC